MAKQLSEFPRRQGRQKYDWDQWLNGKVWELEQGSDFFIALNNFRSAATAAARDKGGKVRTAKTGAKTLVIQFYKS